MAEKAPANSACDWTNCAVRLSLQQHLLLCMLVVTIDIEFEEAERTAERAVDYLSLHGLKVRPRPVETHLDPAIILLDHANQMEAGRS